MPTPSSLQLSPAKYFLLGIVFGVGFNSIIGWLITVFYTFLSAIFWDMVSNNANIFALISILITLGLSIVCLIVAQQTFNNRFTTIGIASGLVISTALMAMQSALMSGR